jgi:hypothetical protein
LRACPSCVGRTVTQEEWDRRAAKQGITWLEPVKTARTNTAALHECGYAWDPAPSSIASGSGCPRCAIHGFKEDEPYLLYLLRAPSDGALKVGITITPDNTETAARLRKHRQNGWNTVEIWSFDTGRAAYDMEQLCVGWWRYELELPQARKRGDGWTETVSSELVTAREVTSWLDERVAMLHPTVRRLAPDEVQTIAVPRRGLSGSKRS